MIIKGRKADDCDFMRNLFDVNFPCCSDCHEEAIIEGKNLPIDCKERFKDLPELYLCCAFRDFVSKLEPKQKNRIRIAYDKDFYIGKRRGM